MEVKVAKQPPLQPGSVPWLVFKQKRSSQHQIFWSIDNPESHKVEECPELKYKKILNCSHGWLVLLNLIETRLLSLWNPVTSERIELPPLPSTDNRVAVVACTLTSHPSDQQNCWVLVFYRDLPLAIFCRPGDKDWKQQFLENEMDNKGWISATSCNGRVYAEARQHFVFDLIAGDRLVMGSSSIPQAPLLYSHRYSHHTAEFRGELFFIGLSMGGMRCESLGGISVFRLDSSKMVWVKMESAKDCVFLVTTSRVALCCPAEEAGMEGNCVYFFLWGDNNLYKYNIEDETVLVTRFLHNSLQLWHPPMWIVPQLQRQHIVTDDVMKNVHDMQNQVEGGNEETEESQIEKEEEIDGGIFCKLPLDIWWAIGSCLKDKYIIDYLRFRFVCRMCRSVAPPVPIHYNGTFSSFPLLMYRGVDREHKTCRLIDPLGATVTDQKYLIRLPTQPSTLRFTVEVCCSKDGWSLMYGFDSKTYDKYMFFWNPFQREAIPMSQFHNTGPMLNNFCFTSEPTANDCIIAGISDHIAGDSSIPLVQIDYIYVGLGKNEIWCRLSSESPKFTPSYSNSPVFFGGKFYFLGQGGNLGTFLLGEERVAVWEVLEKPERPCNSFHENFLLECNGELFSVFVGLVGKWVRVFRLSMSTMEWIEVENLGEYMLFVGPFASFSAVAKNPGMENKIYFPRLYGKSILFYSLDSGKYQTFDSEDCLEDFYNTKELAGFTWLHPN